MVTNKDWLPVSDSEYNSENSVSSGFIDENSLGSMNKPKVMEDYKNIKKYQMNFWRLSAIFAGPNSIPKNFSGKVSFTKNIV